LDKYHLLNLIILFKTVKYS